MTVGEAVNLLAYGQAFYLKGAYSGKIYHQTWSNKADHLEQFKDELVHDTPFFTDLYTSKRKYGTPYTYPVIGIWISDYELCRRKEQKDNERERPTETETDPPEEV